MRSARWLVPALTLGMVASTAMASGQYYGQQGPPPPRAGYGQNGYGPGGWDQAPQEFRDVMRRGYRDGIEGARKDYENHRPPNVRNRDEFRDPSFIARPDRHDYRMGFRRGYKVGVEHIYGGRRYDR